MLRVSIKVGHVLTAEAVALQWRMPNSAIGRLSQTGFLYLQQPGGTKERVNMTVVSEAVNGNNTDRLIVPFHIEADLSVRFGSGFDHASGFGSGSWVGKLDLQYCVLRPLSNSVRRAGACLVSNICILIGSLWRCAFVVTSMLRTNCSGSPRPLSGKPGQPLVGYLVQPLQ